MSVREAAERLVNSGPEYYWNLGSYGTQYIEDLKLLSRTYLAEHPADEFDPITDAWLREIGFRRYADECSAMYLPADAYGEKFGPIVGLSHKCEWLINGTFIGTKIKTRGQLRKLLQALGVETKGGA